MAREYVEKNTAEMVRCLKELVAIPGIFEDAPSKEHLLEKISKNLWSTSLEWDSKWDFR